MVVPSHSALKVRSGVKSGAEGQPWNHSALEVRSRIKAGGTLVDICSPPHLPAV